MSFIHIVISYAFTVIFLISIIFCLQCYTVESSESLPDTLDIGDVSEFGSSADCASLKLKAVKGEASAASSSS